MMEAGEKERLLSPPAVDAVLRDPSGLALVDLYGRARATSAVREALDDLRRRISAGETPGVSEKVVVDAASGRLAGGGLARVVNATGVILHTNLGRSVLSERAVLAAGGGAPRRSQLWKQPPYPRQGSRYEATR